MRDAHRTRWHSSRRRWNAATPRSRGVSPMSQARKATTTTAATHLAAARAGFETLLAKHPLAFADHAAEFYRGTGGDSRRAFELARLNLANRPTVRAFEQAHATALAAGESVPHR